MKTLSLSEVKMKLSELVDQVKGRDEVVTITKNGKVAAVIVSGDEYESWQETQAIRANKPFMKEIRRGLKALKKVKKTYSVEELFRSTHS
ncbi:MAG: type II toxin-antitoxin system Phd/YefM family antitoxin [Deltaproteobacteria bacterium]|nr:type II toxin-antitoxin system Phd/YefM family antitoxin [Deltaproteobacteria bacterium]